jgi:hypothetical protein
MQVKLAYTKELLTPGDCRRALSKEMSQKVSAADGIMCQWRGLLQNETFAKDHRVVAAMGFADMSLAALTLGVKIPGEKKYEKPEGLAHDVVLILRGISGQHITSPWECHREVAEDGEGEKKPMSFMRELNHDGSLKDPAELLHEAGFQVGQHVRRRADSEAGVIVAVESGKVRLVQVGSSPRFR